MREELKSRCCSSEDLEDAVAQSSAPFPPAPPIPPPLLIPADPVIQQPVVPDGAEEVTQSGGPASVPHQEPLRLHAPPGPGSPLGSTNLAAERATA